LAQDTPELPLVYVPRFFTYNDKVKGFSTDGDGRFNAVSFGLSRVWIDRYREWSRIPQFQPTR
jgi:hypothetical protein